VGLFSKMSVETARRLTGLAGVSSFVTLDSDAIADSMFTFASSNWRSSVLSRSFKSDGRRPPSSPSCTITARKQAHDIYTGCPENVIPRLILSNPIKATGDLNVRLCVPYNTYSGAGTNLKVGGIGPVRKWGTPIPRKVPGKNWGSCPSTFSAITAQLEEKGGERIQGREEDGRQGKEGNGKERKGRG